MSRPAVIAASLIVLVVASAPMGDAQAQRTRDKARETDRALLERRIDRVPDRAPRDVRQERSEDHRALSAAVRRVERRTGGQVLSAERVPFDGRDVNRVKVVDDRGRVRVYVDDPVGGRSAGALRTRSDDN